MRLLVYIRPRLKFDESIKDDRFLLLSQNMSEKEKEMSVGVLTRQRRAVLISENGSTKLDTVSSFQIKIYQDCNFV